MAKFKVCTKLNRSSQLISCSYNERCNPTVVMYRNLQFWILYIWHTSQTGMYAIFSLTAPSPSCPESKMKNLLRDEQKYQPTYVRDQLDGEAAPDGDDWEAELLKEAAPQEHARLHSHEGLHRHKRIHTGTTGSKRAQQDPHGHNSLRTQAQQAPHRHNTGSTHAQQPPHRHNSLHTGTTASIRAQQPPQWHTRLHSGTTASTRAQHPASTRAQHPASTQAHRLHKGITASTQAQKAPHRYSSLHTGCTRAKQAMHGQSKLCTGKASYARAQQALQRQHERPPRGHSRLYTVK
jgi:hypothetical protein